MFSQKNPKSLSQVGRVKERVPLTKRLAQFASTQLKSLAETLRPDTPSIDLAATASINDFLGHTGISSIVPITDISADGLLLIDHDSDENLRLGFILEYTPFLTAGIDAEGQIEAVIQRITTDGATIQFAALCNADVLSHLSTWKNARQAKNTNPMLDEMTQQRFMHLAGGAHNRQCGEREYGYSLAKTIPINIRRTRYFLTVTLPYNGKASDKYAWERFHEEVVKTRSSMKGAMEGSGIRTDILTRNEVRHLYRMLLNPQKTPEELRIKDTHNIEDIERPFHSVTNLVEKDTRYRIAKDGTIHVSSTTDENDFQNVAMMPITVDRYPSTSYLPQTCNLMGNLESTTAMIRKPYWFFTNITVVDPESARDRIQIKMARVTRSLISDSPAYRAFMSHLFEMKDQLQELSQQARSGSQIVASTTGMVVISDAKNVAEDAQSIVTSWRKEGFSASPESYISFPMFLASTPGFFIPSMDPQGAQAGLQRNTTMTSFHASTLVPAQTEYGGSTPESSGIPLVSRRGELITVSVTDKKGPNNSYNFVVVAATGSGKSFFTQDIVNDFISQNGLAFIIDAGRSYFEMVETLGGENIVFSIDDPIDLNPFAQIKTETDLAEMVEMIKDVLVYMAWPNRPNNVPDWEYSQLEKAITHVWHEKKERTTIGDIAHWLQNQEDSRAHDVAEQLYPYTQGRLASWFNGTGRQVDLNAQLVCLELDDLKNQGGFRDVALTLIMNRIATVMYGDGDPSRPKLMLIDEAWDLLSSNQAGNFINRAYRTYRKYGGSAGVVTQKFGDFDVSDAARAAYASSEWVFMLAQKPDSLAEAYEKKYLPDDPYTKRLVENVHTRKGEYSEVMVQIQGMRGIYRFIVDPYTYFLYSTDPEDKAKRQAKTKEIKLNNPEISHAEAVRMACKMLAEEKPVSKTGSAEDHVRAIYSSYA